MVDAAENTVPYSNAFGASDPLSVPGYDPGTSPPSPDAPPPAPQAPEPPTPWSQRGREAAESVPARVEHVGALLQLVAVRPSDAVKDEEQRDAHNNRRRNDEERA